MRLGVLRPCDKIPYRLTPPTHCLASDRLGATTRDSHANAGVVEQVMEHIGHATAVTEQRIFGRDVDFDIARGKGIEACEVSSGTSSVAETYPFGEWDRFGGMAECQGTTGARRVPPSWVAVN